MFEERHPTKPILGIYVRAFRSFIIPSFRTLYRVLSRTDVRGYKNIPNQGPYLITSNHLSYYDPPLTLSFWPHQAEVLGAADHMEKPGVGHVMRYYGTHPVRRDSSDIPVLRLALRLLRSGYPLLIMPEGKRNPDGLGEAQLGAAYLASKADVPIIPVGITGTEQLFPSLRRGSRQEIRMIIGNLYRLPPLEITNHKQKLRAWTHIIMSKIASLLPEDYRGVYGA